VRTADLACSNIPIVTMHRPHDAFNKIDRCRFTATIRPFYGNEFTRISIHGVCWMTNTLDFTTDDINSINEATASFMLEMNQTGWSFFSTRSYSLRLRSTHSNKTALSLL
jgi:hypothetical protein